MNAPADLLKASLEDKYTLDRGRVFLTGTQALVRLMLMQRQRDAIAGLDRACECRGTGVLGEAMAAFDVMTYGKLEVGVVDQQKVV